MLFNQWVLGFGVAAMLVACGGDGGADGDGGGDAGDEDRGGPDALIGFSWWTTQTANGIEFKLGFEFGATTLVAANTCTANGESLTASVEVPVKYRYSASISEGAKAGSDACFVEVSAGKFDFELVGDKLLATSGDSVIEFSPEGGHSGLYGDWTAESDGFKLTWSMGDGEIHASASCPGVSDSPAVTVDADFVNFVDVLEAGEDMVGDDSFSCQMAVMQALMEYRFDDSALILTFQGQDTRLSAD